MPKKEHEERPNSKVIKKLEDHFGMSFPQIVKTYFKMGMSRYTCTETLNSLTGWRDPKKPDKKYFKHATIWNMVKDGIKRGEIKEFDFAGRTKGNRRYTDKIRGEVPTIVPVESHEMPKEITAAYHCSDCKKAHKSKFKVNDANLQMTLLRAHQCPHCQKRATCTMDFEHDGIRARKAVILVMNMKREEFVDENFDRVDNPFQYHSHVECESKQLEKAIGGRT